jgi:hypothetical protein
MTFVAFPASQYWTKHPHPLVSRRIFQGQRVVALAYVVVFVAGMEF